MTKTLIALAAIVAYVALGMGTYGSTAASTKEACIAAPNYIAHVAMWPISYGTSAGLQSGC